MPMPEPTPFVLRGEHITLDALLTSFEAVTWNATRLAGWGDAAWVLCGCLAPAGVAVMLSLWNEENDVRVIQRRLQLDQPIVEVFSNDPRLADLRAWDPTSEPVS